MSIAKIYLVEGADPAAFEQSALTGVLASPSMQPEAEHGQLSCSLYRDREFSRWETRAGEPVIGQYLCLVASATDGDQDLAAAEDLFGLETPLRAVGAQFLGTSVWQMRGTVPDSATAGAGEGADQQAVILTLRVPPGDGRAEFERELVSTLGDIVAEPSSSEHAFTSARWYFVDPSRELPISPNYLCQLTGPNAGTGLPAGSLDRLREAGAVDLFSETYDHVGSAPVGGSAPRVPSGRG